MVDLQNLHAKTPQLMDLKFEKAKLWPSNNNGNQQEASINIGRKKIASNLEPFELYFDPHAYIEVYDELLSGIASNMLSYLGNDSFKNLQKLHFEHHGSFYHPSTQLVEESVLLETVSKLPSSHIQ